jgi:hypothetical protein
MNNAKKKKNGKGDKEPMPIPITEKEAVKLLPKSTKKPKQGRT